MIKKSVDSKNDSLDNWKTEEDKEEEEEEEAVEVKNVDEKREELKMVEKVEIVVCWSVGWSIDVDCSIDVDWSTDLDCSIDVEIIMEDVPIVVEASLLIATVGILYNGVILNKFFFQKFFLPEKSSLEHYDTFPFLECTNLPLDNSSTQKTHIFETKI